MNPARRSVPVYAPPTKNFVAIEPRFNLPDPYNQNWGTADTGMVPALAQAVRFSGMSVWSC